MRDDPHPEESNGTEVLGSPDSPMADVTFPEGPIDELTSSLPAADSIHPEEPITEAQPEPQPGEPAYIGPAGPMEEVPVKG